MTALVRWQHNPRQAKFNRTHSPEALQPVVIMVEDEEDGLITVEEAEAKLRAAGEIEEVDAAEEVSE